MIEARRHHRQLRAKQRGAVALRHGHEGLQAIEAGACRPRARAFKRTLATVVQVFALIALSQFAFRVACILTLPGPAGVAAIIMLLGFLSSRFTRARWAAKGVVLMRLYWAPIGILATLGIAASGDVFVAPEPATTLTLLAGTAACVAIAGRMRQVSARMPRQWTLSPAGAPGAGSRLTFT